MTAGAPARIFEPGFTTKGGRIGMGLGLLITVRSSIGTTAPAVPATSPRTTEESDDLPV
jgi:hypothetical protein